MTLKSVERPLISVCIPTYNPDLRHLRALLDSVVAQSWPNVEILVSDDSSRNADGIKSLLQNSGARWIAAPNRLGMVGNWNYAVAAATGDFVIVPGQDDVLYPDCLERLALASIDSNGPLDLCFGREEYIDEIGRPVAPPSRAVGPSAIFPPQSVRFSSDVVLRLGLCYGNIFADPCAAMIRRSAFLQVQGFSELYGHAADLEMWMRLARAQFHVGRTPHPVAARRIHNGNATVTHVRTGVAHGDRVRLHEEYGEDLDDLSYNRSVVRIRLHAARDDLSQGRLPRSPGVKMRGPKTSQARGLYRELLETARLLRPQIMGNEAPLG